MNCHDFLLEKRLREEAPNLHQRIKDSVVVLQKMLESFYTWFPDFTDHSVLHSLDVLDYCNQLLGEQVSALTIPECYALVMACYLHDVGMGVTQENFEVFTQSIDLEAYLQKCPSATIPQIIRDFHNEYSGLFIRKYADLFDIPSDPLLFAIVQLSRGHRKTNLYDELEYPDLETPEGVIRTALLSAVLRLADEIDVGADRNPEILFDTSKLTKQVDIDAFGTHESIRSVDVTADAILLRAKPKEARFIPMIEDLAEKIQKTLDYCRDVTERRSDLRITQERVQIIWLHRQGHNESVERL